MAVAAAASDPFALRRFVAAQRPVYDQVLTELRAGRKASHWMWFVFPQLKALGRSTTALHYGIGSRDEALAYMQHPLLGERLRECTRAVLAVQASSALQIFGPVDALKLCSSMTLFEQAAPGEPLFAQVLAQFFDGRRDALTLGLLRSNPRTG